MHVWFSLIFTYFPFYFNLTFSVFFHFSVLMHPDLDTVENNLRNSAKGSLDTYDVISSLTRLASRTRSSTRKPYLHTTTGSNWQWQDWSGWRGGDNSSFSSKRRGKYFCKWSELKTRTLTVTHLERDVASGDRKRDVERLFHDLSGVCR